MHTHTKNNNNQWVAETVTVSSVNQCKQIPKPTPKQSIPTDKKKACGLRAGSHQLQLFAHDSLQNKSFYTLNLPGCKEFQCILLKNVLIIINKLVN